MAKTKKEKKEKKAGKRMKKKELVKALLDFFHVKQDEVLSLKYIFEQLHLTTHPLKMLCMDIPVSYTHLSNQYLYHPFHLQFEEQGAHPVYGDVRLHYQRIDIHSPKMRHITYWIVKTRHVYI